jgi:hypothetical protein
MGNKLVVRVRRVFNFSPNPRTNPIDANKGKEILSQNHKPLTKVVQNIEIVGLNSLGNFTTVADDEIKVSRQCLILFTPTSQYCVCVCVG